MAKLHLDELIHIELSHSGQPSLFLQIYQQLKTQITEQRLPQYTRLPASRKLASQLKVSRNTVQKAYQQLLAEGYIESKPGSGTDVAAQIPDAYTHITSNTETKQVFPPSQVAKPTIFTPGIPDLAEFPTAIWNKTYRQVLRHHYNTLLFNHSAAGYPELQAAIANYLRYSRAVICDPEQVIITTGTQEGLNILLQSLLTPSQSIAIEKPGYRGVYNVAKAKGCSISQIPVLDDGIDLNALQKRKRKPKLIYVTPSHQYPLGATMPISKRLKLLEYARKNNCYILEDDYDSEFHYQVKPLPSLQGLDKHQRVLYLGTFSKVLFPSVRIGYIVAPKSLITTLSQSKQICFGHTPMLMQIMTAEFIQQGSFARHIKRMRTLYAKKHRALLTACQQHLSSEVKIIDYGVGLHLVILFNDQSINDLKLVSLCKKHKIAAMALSEYYFNKKTQSGLILGFGNTPLDKIESSVMVIKHCLRQQNINAKK